MEKRLLLRVIVLNFIEVLYMFPVVASIASLGLVEKQPVQVEPSGDTPMTPPSAADPLQDLRLSCAIRNRLCLEVWAAQNPK